jgi:hypothetical protein
MAASDEQARLDIGFKGGATLSVSVTVPEADALEQALRSGNGGLVELDTDDGRLLVVSAHVQYLRRHSRGSRVGFSALT